MRIVFIITPTRKFKGSTEFGIQGLTVKMVSFLMKDRDFNLLNNTPV